MNASNRLGEISLRAECKLLEINQVRIAYMALGVTADMVMPCQMYWRCGEVGLLC